MQDHNFESVVSSLFKGMDTVLSTKTVVGEATQIGDTIILPLVDVSFGIGAGAGVADKKNNGAGGMGGKMSPSAVLVIKDGHTKLVNVKNQDAVTKILDMIPDLVPEVISKFTSKSDKDTIDDSEAVEIAFPENHTPE